MIIGLDVGGTHTDVVLLGKEGLIKEVKVPTHHTNLFESVLSGLEQVTAGIPSGQIQRAVLSTTLTTNAIVQGTHTPVAMIVSSGPGVDPEFYRTDENYFVVAGSIDHRGREVEPIREKEIRQIVNILKQKDIKYVGITGKFSTRNPAHELQIYSLIKDQFEKVFLGHSFSGNLNFPRRIATTYLNASMYHIHREFFHAVKKSLEKKGMVLPIHILKADGGTMSFDSSIDYPGQTILSGPAASVMGSIAFSRSKEDTLVMDIGGTTTDMAILIDRTPVLNPLGITLGRFKTLIRSLETLSIGVGGDSTIRVSNGNITIGPDRTDFAMAFGGSVPTPTDSLVVLNLMPIGNRDKSREGIQQIADQLNISVETAADRILNQACQMILTEAGAFIDRINSKPVYTIQELKEGYHVNPKKIMILGGPAPYFAKRMETVSKYQIEVVPKWDVANAIGAGLARTTCEVTFFADTEQEVAFAPEENFRQSIKRNFSKKDAIQKATELLRKKAVAIGAMEEDLESEVIEDLEFNMVRGFYTSGKNIRVKVQIKPGLIKGYETIISSGV